MRKIVAEYYQKGEGMQLLIAGITNIQIPRQGKTQGN
jgi:hypothetical protein